ncbi:MAG TPA: fatty acid desaturase [Steroidobacteraceae bacterium]|nr:fatty acid desaturase [Steroidobacteraceae bacterium]
MTLSIDFIKQHKRVMISRFGKSENIKGLTQVLTTLLPLILLWSVAVFCASALPWVAAAAVPLITLFTLRVFALMHECGHGSLFRSHRLNRMAGFLLGVVAGMPQYVWSKHHSYHHAHNGNWEKYRGPYATLAVDEYASLTAGRQRMYRIKCSMAMAPLAGFIYLIFNPRFTWIRGSIAWTLHVVGKKLTQPHRSLRGHAASFQCRYWQTSLEYSHMFWNNVVLLSLWALMCWACGGALFFSIYLLSVSIAGGMGIVLFTVQHNFEHAYASSSERWDHDTGAIEGTSYLQLPNWMNWFTANIGYHHIHHLSANIPNYRLVDCHAEYEHLFAAVTRVKLSQVGAALKCILWDRQARRIISVAEYRQRG